MGCSRMCLCDCWCLPEFAVVNRLIFPCICLCLWSQLLQLSTAMTPLHPPLHPLKSLMLPLHFFFSLWLPRTTYRLHSRSIEWMLKPFIIKWTLSNTQTAFVFFFVQSNLSFLRDNFTTFLYRHNLLIAQNGWLKREGCRSHQELWDSYWLLTLLNQHVASDCRRNNGSLFSLDNSQHYSESPEGKLRLRYKNQGGTSVCL